MHSHQDQHLEWRPLPPGSRAGDFQVDTDATARSGTGELSCTAYNAGTLFMELFSSSSVRNTPSLSQNYTLYWHRTRKVRLEIMPLLSTVPMRSSEKYLYTTICTELKSPKPAPSFSAQRKCFLMGAPSSAEFLSFGIVISNVKADSPPFHLALIYFSCCWNLVDLLCCGSLRATVKWLRFYTCTYIYIYIFFLQVLFHYRLLWEGNGNSLQYSCLKNSTERGAWRVTAHGVAKSQTWLNTHNDRFL